MPHTAKDCPQCPFCGTLPRFNAEDPRLVACMNRHCGICGIYMQRQQWAARKGSPIHNIAVQSIEYLLQQVQTLNTLLHSSTASPREIRAISRQLHGIARNTKPSVGSTLDPHIVDKSGV